MSDGMGHTSSIQVYAPQCPSQHFLNAEWDDSFFDNNSELELKPHGQVTHEPSGLHFQGGYASLNSSNPLRNNLTAMTVAMWIYPESFDGEQVLFENYDSETYISIVLQNPSAIYMKVEYYNVANREPTTQISPIPTNAWTHVAMSVYSLVDQIPDTTGIFLYINGTRYEQVGRNRFIKTSANADIILGANGIGDSSFKGYMKGIKLFSCSLPQESIEELVRGGPYTLPPPSTPAQCFGFAGICIDGDFIVFNDTVLADVIYIQGDLTVNSGTLLRLQNATIRVEGCVNLFGDLDIDTVAETTTVLQWEGENCTLNFTRNKDPCNTQEQYYEVTGNSLIAVVGFTTSCGSYDIWIPIVCSISVAVVLIILITIIILSVYSRDTRERFLPL